MVKVITRFLFLIIFLFQFNYAQSPDWEDLECGSIGDYGDESQEGGRFKPSETGQGEYFRILVVFAQFADDNASYGGWTSGQLPDWADDFIDDEVSSPYTDITLSDYWDEMSQSNFDFIGDVYPQLVSLPAGTTYFNQSKNFTDANLDVLDSIQANVDWSDYDNWEYDAVNDEFDFVEGDADGYVDMIYIIYRDAAKSWFGEFTAIATLGDITYDYETHDDLKIRFQTNYVSVLGSGLTFRNSGFYGHPGSMGIVNHEFGHYLFGGGHPNYGGIMGGGTYALNGWELNKLGYVAWSEADQDAYTITLGDMIDDADLLMIPLDVIMQHDKYYLVENHQRISHYDQIIRGGTQGGGYNWSTDAGSGIYIWLINNGANYPYSCTLMTGDGHWDWEVADTIENSEICDCDLPGFKRTAVNRNTGLSDRAVYVTNWLSPGVTQFMWYDIDPNTKEYWLSRDRLGDDDDPWNIDYNELFTPWSSPSSYNGGATDISVRLYSENSGDITVKTYNTVSSAKNLAPAKPQWVSITSDENYHAVVNWEPNQEPDLYQMKIYRAQTTGTTPPTSYSLEATIDAWELSEPPTRVSNWTDTEITVGTGHRVYYKVAAVDSQSQESVISDYDWILDNRYEKRDEHFEFNNADYVLYNNYPNPFNPSTQINYSIKEDGFVSLVVYDILGNEITTLVKHDQSAGNYSVEFNARNLPSGIYFYKLQSKAFIAIKKMLLLK